MRFWLDAQLPPALAPWLQQTFAIEAQAVRELGLLRAADATIFEAARGADVVLVSKDIDFVNLVQQRGAPPRLLWVTCGNASNARLREVFALTLPRALALLADGRVVVEIGDA
ncbi:MAG: DUF5615 family PIN-like protein [Xanthomonadales bacterium]|nr:DUF5615 family PIN-like protein [Xanthomonadales bacterium]